MLSIIIPTLNEGSAIGLLLNQLSHQVDIELEVIVVDGGSTDATKTTAREAGVQLIESGTGRGAQMNKGAKAAAGDYLLFLHADSRLSSNHQLAKAIIQLTGEAGPVAGHFKLSFDTADHNLKQDLRFFEEKTRLNRAGTWNGDQGLLISAETFRTTGGFWEELPFLEDQDFGQRFHQLGRFVTCDSILLTSARRFEQEGFRKRITVNAIIMAMFHLRLGEFFSQAAGIYRADRASVHLDPLPFLKLAKRLIFKGRPTIIFTHLYQLGQYANRNLWQLALARSIRKNQVDHHLRKYDQGIGALIDHPVGHFALMIIVVSWIYFTQWRLSSSR